MVVGAVLALSYSPSLSDISQGPPEPTVDDFGQEGSDMPKVSLKILRVAFQAADVASTKEGRSAGGWVRLAKYLGADPLPYVIAIRPIKGERFQFGCSCKDWIHRRRKNHTLCEHQVSFLKNAIGQPGKYWLFNAGRAFLQVLAVEFDLPVAGIVSSETDERKVA